MSTIPVVPRLELYNRQESMNLDVGYVQDALQRALPLCIQKAFSECSLVSLKKVEVSIVCSAEISEVHRRFLNDPTETDVITFDHGEIIVCADVAEKKAAEFGHSTEAELLLYIVHGLLHLAGYKDKTNSEFNEMSRVQEVIWKKTS